MSTAPLTFTGVSSFSNDLQTILRRALSIAQIPIKQLQSDQADLLQRKQLLTGLNGVVDALGFSVAALGTMGANKGLAASSSDTTKVTVVNTGATQPTTYTIANITSVAKAASETSLSGYADTGTTAVSSSGSLQLVYGATTHPITLGSGKNNLAGLRDAINALGVGVTASILTTGTGATPNYLTVTANGSGATTLKLQDLVSGSPVDLLTTANQGADTVFTLNGVPVTKSSTLINDVVPGLSFTILNTTGNGQTVTLSLATDRNQLSAALNDFVQKYNAVVDQVNAQSGQGAGALTGDYLIRQVQDDLRQLTAYRGNGTVNSLVLLGISLDKTGKMSFDLSAFNALTNDQVSSAFSFLGSATSGLGALSSKFTQLSDPVNGLIHLQQNGYDQSYERVSKQIATLQDRLTVTQTSLSRKLQLADTLLATLQSQQNMLTQSLLSVSFTTYGKNFGNNGQA